jgi:hypothetical protein
MRRGGNRYQAPLCGRFVPRLFVASIGVRIVFGLFHLLA